MKFYISSLALVFVIHSLVTGMVLKTEEGVRVCHASGDCEPGECCRTTSGALLTLSGVFDHIGPIRMSENNGTCVTRLAQLKEHCNDFCPCDEANGLECYRDVIEDGFIPAMCREKDFVNQKTKDFIECYSDPNCILPLS